MVKKCGEAKRLRLILNQDIEMTHSNQHHVVNHCNATIKTMVDFIKSKYDVPAFDVVVKLDFSERRTTSWGGIRNQRGFISLSLSRYLGLERSMVFREYPRFSKDSVIGSLEGSWSKCIAALVAHELAHVVQYYARVTTNIKMPMNVERNSVDESGHNALWRNIYKTLRTEFVNDDTITTYTPVKPAPVAKPVTVKPVVTAPVEKPVAVNPVTATTKPSSKDWASTWVAKGGGYFTTYTRKSDGSLIGILFNRQGQTVYLVNHMTGEYIKSETTSLKVAREIFFGI